VAEVVTSAAPPPVLEAGGVVGGQAAPEVIEPLVVIKPPVCDRAPGGVRCRGR
jgi:hypothetical protein